MIRKPRENLICNSCNQPYDVWPCLHKTSKYCSRECKDKDRNGKTFFEFWKSANPIEQLERIKQLFEKNVIKTKENNCWDWKTGKNRNGYGKMTIGGKSKTAHRISWLIHNGEIPEGLYVLHNCPIENGGDNTTCSNPSHLYLGTNIENMADMARKKRTRPQNGELNFTSKLTDIKVKEIKELLKNKISTYVIADMYDVTQSVICSIKNKKTWKHIKD